MTLSINAFFKIILNDRWNNGHNLMKTKESWNWKEMWIPELVLQQKKQMTLFTKVSELWINSVVYLMVCIVVIQLSTHNSNCLGQEVAQILGYLCMYTYFYVCIYNVYNIYTYKHIHTYLYAWCMLYTYKYTCIYVQIMCVYMLNICVYIY